jgi:hypothetical protein
VEFVSNVYLINGKKVIQYNITGYHTAKIAGRRQAEVIEQPSGVAQSHQGIERIAADLLQLQKNPQ